MLKKSYFSKCTFRIHIASQYLRRPTTDDDEESFNRASCGVYIVSVPFRSVKFFLSSLGFLFALFWGFFTFFFGYFVGHSTYNICWISPKDLGNSSSSSRSRKKEPASSSGPVCEIRLKPTSGVCSASSLGSHRRSVVTMKWSTRTRTRTWTPTHTYTRSSKLKMSLNAYWCGEWEWLLGLPGFSGRKRKTRIRLLVQSARH